MTENNIIMPPKLQRVVAEAKANEIQTSGSNYQMEIPSIGQSGGVLGGVITVIGVILTIRRRTSKDNLEIAKDKAETNFVKVLQNEREEALKSAAEAWKQRTEDAKAISRLTAELDYMTREKVEQDRRITEMKTKQDAIILEMKEKQNRLIKIFSQYAPPEIRGMLVDF